MITGLAHVCFTVRDLDRVLAFYQDILGFPVAFEFRRENGERFGAYLKAGGRCFIELFVGALKEPADGQSFKHICLEVDDMEATVAALRDRGVDVGPITLGADQSWQAWLADPDGNRIELHQYTPESWQAPHLG